jgi:hypothetical protein
MKRIVIGLLFFCTLLNAGPQDQRIHEIEREMSALEKQKQELQQEISADYRQEMKHEMEGQKEFIDYQWHNYAETLKKAEAAEQTAHNKEEELHKINQTLIQLKKEKNTLQQDKSTH